MWRRLLPVSGRATEVHGIDAQDPVLQLVVIAGNPGSAGYYSAFLEALYTRFEQRAHVWAVSSLGFQALKNPHDTEAPTFTLKQQCAHKAELLRDHVLAAHDLPVVLMGHSIGAYMAVKALAALEGEKVSQRIVQVISLFPFLRTTPSNRKQRVLRFVCRYAGVLAGVAHALEHVPGPMRRALVSVFGANMDDASLRATDALLRWDTVRNAFVLAACEFRDLDDDSIWHAVAQLSGRLCVLGAPNDHWFPRAHYERCCQLLPAADLHWDESQMHAFCVTRWHSRSAARVVEPWIRQALADANAVTG